MLTTLDMMTMSCVTDRRVARLIYHLLLNWKVMIILTYIRQVCLSLRGQTTNE
jgi:hypothetical protein